MASRTATAVWEGTLQEGKGSLALGSGAFEGAYSFSSRFEEGTGTNPEELLVAAHAGCFTMQLGASLGRAGFPATRIETKGTVQMQRVDEKMTITRIDLVTEAEVPGVSEEQFMELANDAKANCIISRALAGVPEFTLEATLKS
ncbi:MAG: OsmC family protein [Anaerolineae bacterium]